MSTNRLSETQLGEYIDMAYLSHPYHQANYAKRLENLFGSKSIYPLFGQGKPTSPAELDYSRRRNPDYEESPWVREGQPASLKTGIPWSQSTKNKGGFSYDPSLVSRVIHDKPSVDNLREFDPRFLSGSQPSVTSSGVLHYLEHGQHGDLHADHEDVGNQTPFVYIHPHTGELRLLGGHHRATAALIKGEPLRAKFVVGDY
jgi:hypothetical protein